MPNMSLIKEKNTVNMVNFLYTCLFICVCLCVCVSICLPLSVWVLENRVVRYPGVTDGCKPSHVHAGNET